MNILVIGKAKTGTTIISKTIQNSLENTEYHLEPKEICFFENQKIVGNGKANIVKIIFEHWSKRPRLRNAIIHNECKLKFGKIVCIVRDPRDEMISRLLYVIYPYVTNNGLDNERINKWLNIIKRKEQYPQKVSFFDVINKYAEIFGGDFLHNFKVGGREYPAFLSNNSKKTGLIKYEDFIDGNCRHLEDYLGFKLTDKRDVGELGRTNRTASYNNWKEFFTAQDIERIKEYMGESVQQMGYNDWKTVERDSLNSRNYSEYIIKLLEPFGYKRKDSLENRFTFWHLISRSFSADLKNQKP